MQISHCMCIDQYTCIRIYRGQIISNSEQMDKMSQREVQSEQCGGGDTAKDSTCLYTWDTTGVEHTLVLG